MKSKDSEHVWASYYLKGPRHNLKQATECADTLTVYTNDAQEHKFSDRALFYRLPGHFRTQTHTDKRGRPGGHNWWMTTRVDVWANFPDGRVWHGVLITGGWNESFRMHPTKETWVRYLTRYESAPGVWQTAMLTPHWLGFNRRSRLIHCQKRKRSGGEKFVAKIVDGALVRARKATQISAARFYALAETQLAGQPWPVETYDDKEASAA